MHGGTGEQTSGTPPFAILHQEKGDQVFRERLLCECSLLVISVHYFVCVLVSFNITMSTEVQKNAANKKVAEENAVPAATMTWPTGWYMVFIPLWFIPVFVLLVVYVDVSIICVVRAWMIRYHYNINDVSGMVMIYF